MARGSGSSCLGGLGQDDGGAAPSAWRRPPQPEDRVPARRCRGRPDQLLPVPSICLTDDHDLLCLGRGSIRDFRSVRQTAQEELRRQALVLVACGEA